MGERSARHGLNIQRGGSPESPVDRFIIGIFDERRINNPYEDAIMWVGMRQRCTRSVAGYAPSIIPDLREMTFLLYSP
jgi:hypothetical protein